MIGGFPVLFASRRKRNRVPFVVMVAAILLVGNAPAFADDDQSADTATTSRGARDTDSGPAWKGALADSLRLLAIEHTTRIAFQEKTRRELTGPFVSDYLRSVKWPKTWNDGDAWGVNYIGHPIHGAASGFIWLDHETGSHDVSMGFSREYWASRGRATAWAAGYSLQFEFGPISEASIGNVGMNPATTGWVDHVVTPAGAFGFMLAEDALDRYLITRIEGWTDSKALRVLARTFLNPSRTLSNAAQGRTLWYRIERPLH